MGEEERDTAKEFVRERLEGGMATRGFRQGGKRPVKSLTRQKK